MSHVRKTRTPTSQFEQSVLTSHMEKYFEAPDRSEERCAIVREVLDALQARDRNWTPRSVRLWFNNNRKHCLGGIPAPPEPRPRPRPPPPPIIPPPLGFRPPMPPPCVFQFVPMPMEGAPPPMYWPHPMGPGPYRLAVDIDPLTGLPRNPQQAQPPVQYIAMISYPPPRPG
jgi:hypothetical protein